MIPRPRTIPSDVNHPEKTSRTKLSKDLIIDAAFALLCNDPHEVLTFERIAAAIGASPMSLYVHVGTKEVLLDELANRALSRFDPRIDRTAPWQEQLCSCLEATFALVREIPAPLILLLRLSSGALIGWAPIVAEIARTARGADLDAAQHAAAVRWVIRALLPLAISEALFPSPTLFLGLGGSLERIPESDRQVLVALLPHMIMPEDPAQRAKFLARRIVDGVEGYPLGQRAARGATPLPRRQALSNGSSA